MMNFAPGDQVAYVPTHADGDLKHPDVEFGFVTSMRPAGDAAFCRYWRRGHLGELRTVANSECTPVDLLVPHQSVSQTIVDDVLRQLDLSLSGGNLWANLN